MILCNVICWSVMVPFMSFGGEIWALSEKDKDNIMAFQRVFFIIHCSININSTFHKEAYMTTIAGYEYNRVHTVYQCILQTYQDIINGRPFFFKHFDQPVLYCTHINLNFHVFLNTDFTGRRIQRFPQSSLNQTSF